MNTKIFRIGNHFLSALINADESGLNKEDILALSTFLQRNNLGHAYAPDEEDDIGFIRCDVTGLWSNCHTLTFEILGVA